MRGIGQWLCIFLCTILTLHHVEADEDAVGIPAVGDEIATAPKSEAADETTRMLKHMTISIVSDVLDERTVVVRGSGGATGKKKVFIRLGNTAAAEQGTMTEVAYANKRESSKAALEKLIGKKLIWWQAAADEHQLSPVEGRGDSPEAPVVVEIWQPGGKHVNSVMTKDKHLEPAEEYTSDMSKNILSAAAEESKADTYKKLEEAMKENDRENKRQQKIAKETAAAQAALEESEEPIGIAGWIGLSTVIGIILFVVTHASGSKKKRVNCNRQKGPLESFWGKLKGH